MDKMMDHGTRKGVLAKLRRRYANAGAKHKGKLLDQAVELLGYHRKAAIRALGRVEGMAVAMPSLRLGRPVEYEAAKLLPWLKPIWEATDYACGRRLVAMLPEWVPAYEAHHRRLPGAIREQLLEASGRTLDRLVSPLRVGLGGRSLTRPGTLLRHQIPIRGSVWDEGSPGWLEADTVALCGGRTDGEFVWMVDGVDHATTWVEVRGMWGRGQEGTRAALANIEESLPFELLGLDSDNGGEFLNYHVINWLQKRPRPVFLTRSRPYKKDDNAHVEQKNWTHVREWFGYERYDNAAVVEPINRLARGPLGQLLNCFHASLKLERKERKEGKIRRIYGPAQTPMARVLAHPAVTSATKARLREQKSRLNPFALKRDIEKDLKEIARLRQAS
jgi:hypothetical protein